MKFQVLDDTKKIRSDIFQMTADWKSSEHYDSGLASKIRTVSDKIVDVLGEARYKSAGKEKVKDFEKIDRLIEKLSDYIQISLDMEGALNKDVWQSIQKDLADVSRSVRGMRKNILSKIDS